MGAGEKTGVDGLLLRGGITYLSAAGTDGPQYQARTLNAEEDNGPLAEAA
jgi:hypothetical protein